MEERLHGDLLREVGEHNDAIVGTLVGAGVAKGRHAVGEIVEAVEALDAAAGCGERGRLGEGVDANTFLATLDVADAASNRLEQRLGVGHIIVAEEGAVRSHIGERQHRGVVVQGVELLGHLKHLVERDG